ncbi:protein mono-ADP-ribosyltransferase Parp16 [Drosophila miranda]|uniref:protein mono-ADP-ribosyltransferase Parp16 n=1 Tax=Drosophila miranda TaxID=7229 RepID=UPI0007E67513|nr:protein mono-ADP-ribosyltransferase Parp16 [Drosophila miranda]
MSHKIFEMGWKGRGHYQGGSGFLGFLFEPDPRPRPTSCQRMEWEYNMCTWAMLQLRLKADLQGCAALWDIFAAAALNYRRDSRLLPSFPKRFLEPNIDLLCHTVADVPPLEGLLQDVIESGCYQGSYHVVQLLYTVLVEQGDIATLRTIDKEKIELLYDYLAVPTPKTSPTHVFEVARGRKMSRRREVYEALKANHRGSVCCGFLACKPEMVYALIHREALPSPMVLAIDADEALALSEYCSGGSPFRYVAIVEFLRLDNEMTHDMRHVIISNPKTMEIGYLMFYDRSCDGKLQEEATEISRFQSFGREAASSTIYYGRKMYTFLRAGLEAMGLRFL